jgi:hypothetical protein
LPAFSRAKSFVDKTETMPMLRRSFLWIACELLLWCTHGEEQQHEEEYEVSAFARMGPVRNVLKARSNVIDSMSLMESLRGGASENLDETIRQLGVQFGPDFLNAIEQVRDCLYCSLVSFRCFCS